jgi:hypothetical protein
MRRRELLGLAAGFAIAGIKPIPAQLVERSGAPHAGKVLAAIQPHADDIALLCAGTVAKLIGEGYTGYMIRATNEVLTASVTSSARTPLVPSRRCIVRIFRNRVKRLRASVHHTLRQCGGVRGADRGSEVVPYCAASLVLG